MYNRSIKRVIGLGPLSPEAKSSTVNGNFVDTDGL